MNEKIITAELAGQDSVAAIIKYAKENPGSFIQSVIIKVPPEEDVRKEMVEYSKKLAEYIKENTDSTYFSIPFGEEAKTEWYCLNRPIQELQEKYGFYSPCIACHGLVHALRIPVTQMWGGKIITGERLSHNGKIKINQNTIVLNAYDELFKEHGIEVIRPLEDIEDPDMIDDILKDFNDKYDLYSFGFAKCYMSGNCKIKTEEDLKKYRVKEYCEEYLIPKLNKIILEKQSEI